MPWVAVENNHDEFWSVLYEITDHDGTKGYVGLLVDDVNEITARKIAHRLND